MASLTALTTVLTTALLAATPLNLPADPIPLQRPGRPAPLLSQAAADPAGLEAGSRRGSQLTINGRSQRAAWLWLTDGPGGQPQLWLPLEVLQGQLGFSSRSRSDGSLDLEWFGRGLLVPPSQQRSLDDEVAVEVAGLLQAAGVGISARDGRLDLLLPQARLLRVRSAALPGRRRVVLDLNQPALVRLSEAEVLLGLASETDQQQQLSALGLRSRQRAEGLSLEGTRPSRVFTLGDPARVVLDLPAAAGSAEARDSTPIDPRLQALLGRGVQWDRQVRQLPAGRMRITSVRLDPRRAPLELRPLSRADGMEGLSSLPELARSRDALVAINGGYFNRVRRLPLGAIKDGGTWLSGPILNRGVVAWEPRTLPRFGRLRLEEWLSDRQGRSWPLTVVNSGYVLRGISRYTAGWGPIYRPLSGNETAVLLRDGVIRERFDSQTLAAGVPLRPGESLLVARGGAELPWADGEALTLQSRTSDPLGEASHVIGGGPLLLQAGQIVLNGPAEGFSPAFLSQGAPRTVIGSDGNQLWLVTLEGVDQDGPTLAETAALLQQLGLRDALNLDGGSSTGLVMGGNQTVRGRGVAGRVHHGLGLVPGSEAGAGGGGGGGGSTGS